MLVAAPSYLAARGVPRRLADPAHHSCIVLRQEHAAYDIWRLGDDQGVRVAGTLATTDGEIAVSWVLDGHGIMLRSEWDIAPHVSDRTRTRLNSSHSFASLMPSST